MTTQDVLQTSRRTWLEKINRRRLNENLMAFAFLTPAIILVFIFEFFPVAFTFFVSLHEWRRFPDEFKGLEAYYRALGNFAYVIFFWISLIILICGLYLAWRSLRQTRSRPKHLLYVIPGFAVSMAFLGLVNWLFTLLPIIMDVVRRLRGQPRTNAVFVNEFFNSFFFPKAVQAGWWLVVLSAFGLLTVIGFTRMLRQEGDVSTIFNVAFASVVLAAGGWLLRLNLMGVHDAIQGALADGTTVPIWSQTLLITVGAALVGAGLYVWQTVVRAETNRGFWLRGLLVVMLLVGGTMLVTEVPRALVNADDRVLNGLAVAMMYSGFSVPLQLCIGLLLAVLLFQKIKMRSFFRVVFFMPYITPVVATSVVFSLLFSPDPQSPINQFMQFWGLENQRWLLEPTGIFRMLFGDAVPAALAGPPLALAVIILFGVWSFAGYSTVIFLAGLGNIDVEVYEAAKIDGANTWQQFRHVTLPLLSPTTFFLILVTTIGTLQAFTQFFLMRRPGALQAVDTINLQIFDNVRTTSPDYGYGSAMAFILFVIILILTIIQNRTVGRNVFYG